MINKQGWVVENPLYIVERVPKRTEWRQASLANRSIASTNGGNSVFNSSPLLSEVGHAMNRYVNLKFVRLFVSCQVCISLHFTAEGAVAMEYCWCSLSTSKLVSKKIVIAIRLRNFFFSFFFMTRVHYFFTLGQFAKKELGLFSCPT